MSGTLIVSPGTDLGSVLLPDDAELIPCENADHTAPVAARWACTCPQCGVLTLVCDGCRARCDGEHHVLRLLGRGLTCTPCGYLYPPGLPWVRI